MKSSSNIFRVIKTQSDRFTVDVDGGRIVCCSRKKNKRDEILTGDFVVLNGDTIESVQKRKNRLIRPAIANIDQIIFVVCSVPAPDFFLLDKVIVNCLKNDIDVIICINKSDINKQELQNEITMQYVGRKVISVSALTSDLKSLEGLLEGKLTALAGQSAVGKSTLVAALTGLDVRVGELSGVGRGKNTTTSTEIYNVFGGYLADTPGFNMLDIHSVGHEELALYYPEFEGLLPLCKYRGCTHTCEPDCAVKQAVFNGEINQKRYDRYLEIFKQLKETDLNKFK